MNIWGIQNSERNRIDDPPPTWRLTRCRSVAATQLLATKLIDVIDTTTVIGLRDRALIGLMVYSFARIGAPIGMRVEDVYGQNRRLWVRLLRGRQAARHAIII